MGEGWDFAGTANNTERPQVGVQTTDPWGQAAGVRNITHSQGHCRPRSGPAPLAAFQGYAVQETSLVPLFLRSYTA